MVEQYVFNEGKHLACAVWDLRNTYRWTEAGLHIRDRDVRRIMIHESGWEERPGGQMAQIDAMRQLAEHGENGLPYNFVVWPGKWRRIYYVNDLDYAWPLWQENGDCAAICAWGAFRWAKPPTGLAWRIRQLILALREHYGHHLSVRFHEQVNGALCPGAFLQEDLIRLGYPWEKTYSQAMVK